MRCMEARLGGGEVSILPFFAKEHFIPESPSFGGGRSYGKLSEELNRELFIWRPIMSKRCSLEAVIDGKITVRHLAKLNALMDMEEYIQKVQQDESK